MQFCIYSVHREIYILSILREIEIEKERKRRNKKRERGGKRSPGKIGVGGFFFPLFYADYNKGEWGGVVRGGGRCPGLSFYPSFQD